MIVAFQMDRPIAPRLTKQARHACMSIGAAIFSSRCRTFPITAVRGSQVAGLPNPNPGAHLEKLKLFSLSVESKVVDHLQGLSVIMRV